MKKFSKVNLEMSLKPFTDASPAKMKEVCATLFDQWKPLYKHADEISIMLWTSDGSEILEYTGDLKKHFEWCKYIGVANSQVLTHAPSEDDPDNISIHRHPYEYIKNPPKFNYLWLKNLVKHLKSYGKKVSGKKISLVATFDPGPEFAKSDFKYNRHPEICMGNTLGRASFVCCYATLHADKHKYAAFPNGIPEGTSIGTFLGKQYQVFMKDLSFDAIWLSNGFGFGLETWDYRGALFDGAKFSMDKAVETRKKVFGFWNDFTKHCKFPIQTRGSNFATGTDLSSDAVPIREIYKKFKPQPPPNSPWAALDGDFGIEIGGWMSHIAEVPGDVKYLFRYYIHDPWFNNSPWLDRYAREMHDIYLPLSVSRINGQGKVCSPDVLSMLSVDNSYGEMPDKVPNEVIPHILTAFEHAPDAAGPLVWLYPFDEYHDMVEKGEKLDEIFFGDWYICGAINQGFPMNTVVSTANFEKTIKKSPEFFDNSILVTPASALTDGTIVLLEKFLAKGGKILFYGPLKNASPKIAKLLGVKCSKELDGIFDIKLKLTEDTTEKGKFPTKFEHISLHSGGGLECELDKGAAKLLAEAVKGKEKRAIAVSVESGKKGGKAVWVRGSVSGKPSKGHHLDKLDPEKNFYPEQLMRLSLQEFGWNINFDKYSPDARTPITMIARNKNGFYFSGYSKDTTTKMRISSPFGIPLFNDVEIVVKDGQAYYHMPKSWHKEVRCFIDQKEESKVSCSENVAIQFDVFRRLKLQGLKNATVRFYPESGTEDRVKVLLNPNPWSCLVTGNFLTPEVKKDSSGTCFEFKNISGSIIISY